MSGHLDGSILLFAPYLGRKFLTEMNPIDRLRLQQEDPLHDALWPQGLPRQQCQGRGAPDDAQPDLCRRVGSTRLPHASIRLRLTKVLQDRSQRFLPEAYRHHRPREAIRRQGHQRQGEGHDRGVKGSSWGCFRGFSYWKDNYGVSRGATTLLPFARLHRNGVLRCLLQCGKRCYTSWVRNSNSLACIWSMAREENMTTHRRTMCLASK